MEFESTALTNRSERNVFGSAGADLLAAANRSRCKTSCISNAGLQFVRNKRSSLLEALQISTCVGMRADGVLIRVTD